MASINADLVGVVVLVIQGSLAGRLQAAEHELESRKEEADTDQQQILKLQNELTRYQEDLQALREQKDELVRGGVCVMQDGTTKPFK